MKTIVPAMLLVLGTAIMPVAVHGQVRPYTGDRSVTNSNAYQTWERFEQELFHRNPADAANVYRTHQGVARCIVRLSGDRAARFFGGPGTSDPRFSALERAMSRQFRNCSNSTDLEGLSPTLLNAVLAEQLVLREADSVAAMPATAAAAQSTEPPTLDSVLACAVRQAPAQAVAVLQQEAGSSGEDAALTSFYAAAPECNAGTAKASAPALMQRVRIATTLYSAAHPAS